LQPLGPGEVEPQGWLRDRAEAMAAGYTGHSHEMHQDFALPWTATFKEPRPAPHCWPYECGAYWLDGLARLAYQLDDPKLIELVKARVEPVLSDIDENTLLFYTCMSRTNAVDLQNFKKEPFFIRAAGQYARGLWAYYLATKDERGLRAFRYAYSSEPDWLNGVLSIKGVSSIMDAYVQGTASCSGGALAAALQDWSRLAKMFDALFDRKQTRQKDWPWHDHLEPPKPGDMSFLAGKQDGNNGWGRWHGVMMSETLGPLVMALNLEGADENTHREGAAWQFAYDASSFSAKVVRKPVKSGFAWDVDAPVEVAADLVAAMWEHDAKNPRLPKSVTPGAKQQVKLVPYGCSRMRVSMFPCAAPEPSVH